MRTRSKLILVVAGASTLALAFQPTRTEAQGQPPPDLGAGCPAPQAGPTPFYASERAHRSLRLRFSVADTLDVVYDSADDEISALGRGWRDALPRLAELADGSIELRGAGAVSRFTRQHDGSYRAVVPENRRLVAEGSNLVLVAGADRTVFAGGVPVRLEDGHGVLVTYGWSGGSIASITDHTRGLTASIGYAGGRLATVTDVAGRTWTLEYDENENLVSLPLVPDGSTRTHFGYAGDRIVSLADASGEVTTLGYAGDGGLATVIAGDGSGYARWCEPAANGGIALHEVDNLGSVTTDIIDASGALVGSVDGMGRSTSIARNADGLVTDIVDPDGLTQHFVYQDGQLVEEELPNGDATHYQRDGGGRATLVQHLVDGEVRESWSFSYDGAGRPTSVTDPLGDLTATTYDGAGNVTRVDYPNGRFETFAYDVWGRLTHRVDVAGRESSFGYDGHGHLASAVDADGHGWSATYTADGRLLTETDTEGRTTTRTYHAGTGLPLSVDGPEGTTTVTARDGAGRPTAWNLATEQRTQHTERSFALGGEVNTYAIDGVMLRSGAPTIGLMPFPGSFLGGGGTGGSMNAPDMPQGSGAN
jgi:YD repeat-containing protein